MAKATLALLLVCCLALSPYTSASICSLVAGVDLCVGQTQSCAIDAGVIVSICGAILNNPINLTIPSSLTVNINANILTALSASGLTINGGASASATATVNLNTALTLASDLIVNGAAVVNAAANTVVRVGGDLRVAAQATIRVAGNVTVSGATYINGRLHMAGDLIQGAAQTAWVKSTGAELTKGIVTLDGGASGTASLTGNGGIDASVTLTANVTVNAGNSPGAIFINGDFTMSSGSTLEIDMVSGLDYDRLYIGGEFKRNGILYVDIEGSYRPSEGSEFTIATHSSSSGEFTIHRGNFDDTLLKIHPEYESFNTQFQYGSAAAIALPFALIALCIVGLVF